MSKKKRVVLKCLGKIGKVLLLWLMVMGLILIWACRQGNESFTMLMTDIRNGFVDNPLFPAVFKNKMILLTGAFAVLLLVVLVTEELQWKIHVFKWKMTVSSAAKGFRIGVNVIVWLVALVFVFSSTVFLGPEIERVLSGDWQKETLIAHACGGIDETNYTNSKEAFENSYANGMRSIEVDFVLTADEKLVCCHDWDDELSSEYGEGYVYTEEEFLALKLHDKYTPMSLGMLFELMQQYEDVWVITDTKEMESEPVRKEFEILVKTAEEMGCVELLDRLVVQLYSHEMYDVVEEIYSFPEYILTLYQLDEPDEAAFIEHCRFSKSRGIETITMRFGWARPELVEIANRYGIDIYVHTINNMDRLEELQAIGVKGFYTDYVLPEYLAQ